MSLDSGHYYDRHGKPCHTYKNKNGEEKKTGLAEARKQILFPSFNTVCKSTLHNQQIVEYAKRCVAEAALKHPWITCGESYESDKTHWIESVLQESDEDRDGAADRGTKIHNAIEKFLRGEPYDMAYAVQVESARAFLAEHEIQICEIEHTFASLEYGYGGTIDLIGKAHSRDVCCDWKSRRTKPGEKVRSYETQPMQIAAYFVGKFGHIPKDAKGFNVYLSTTEDGRIDVIEYGYETLKKEWELFRLLLSYWQMRRDFYPHLAITNQELEVAQP